MKNICQKQSLLFTQLKPPLLFFVQISCPIPKPKSQGCKAPLQIVVTTTVVPLGKRNGSFKFFKK
jgi:hypothetical protein